MKPRSFPVVRIFRCLLVVVLLSACSRNQGRSSKAPVETGGSSTGSAEVTPAQKAQTDASAPELAASPADANLQGSVRAILRRGDGKIWVGGEFTPHFLLLNSVGSGREPLAAGVQLPTVNGPVLSFIESPDGSLILAGNFTDVDGAAAGRIARIQADGKVDSGFLEKAGLGFNGQVTQLLLTSDGRILASGSFTAFDGHAAPFVARLLSDGSLDLSFRQESSGSEQVNPPSLASPPAETEAPNSEGPTAASPSKEVPTTEAPATEAPATEAPATEAPATEAPVADAPAEESPASDIPAEKDKESGRKRKSRSGDSKRKGGKGKDR